MFWINLGSIIQNIRSRELFSVVYISGIKHEVISSWMNQLLRWFDILMIISACLISWWARRN